MIRSTPPRGRSIGPLAKAAGVPTSTLRYYERAGLLWPSARSPAGYRVYDEESLDRLRAIRLCQQAGLGLADVKELLEIQGQRGFYDEVRRRMPQRLAEVDERIGQLQAIRGKIEEALACCEDEAYCRTQCRTFPQALRGCAVDPADADSSASPGSHPLDLALECKR